MKFLKKSLGIVIALLLVAGVAGFNMVQPLNVSVAEVAPKDVKETFTEEGFVKDEDTIDVYALHAGSVISLYVKENQLVQKDEPICQIDSTQLLFDIETARNNQRGFESQIEDLNMQEAQRKDELRVSKNKLQGEYETILAEESSASNAYLNSEISKEEQLNLQNLVIEQNRADLRNAEENLATSEKLFAAGALPQQDLDDIKKNVESLESTLNQNIQELEIVRNSNDTQSREAYFEGAKNSIQSQISGIDTQLGSTYSQAMKEYYQSQIENCSVTIGLLEKQIEECTVKAPATGIITELNIDKSNVASIEEPLATITTGFEPLIEVYVTTSDIGNVKVSDTVELELKSDLENIYLGSVTEIEDRAVLQTSSLGIEKRKVKVTIEPVSESVKFFKPGYDLTAIFTTYYEQGKLTVPRTSVIREGDKSFVWVVSSGKLERREIGIEREMKVDYIVGSGLAAGDVVVKDITIPGLADGKSVKSITD